MIDLAICTDVGNCQVQQDSVAIGAEVIRSRHLIEQRRLESERVLLAVADGVATSPAAEAASRTVLELLSICVDELPNACADGLLGGRHIRIVQQRLSAVLGTVRKSFGASTTLVAAHIDRDRLAIVNVGDSRAYVRSVDGRVDQISRDHTELERLRSEGEIDEDVEYASIYSALSDCLVANSEESDFSIHRETRTLHAGELILLCSDGVHEVLGNQRWIDLMNANATPIELVRATRAEVLKLGAPDNFSLIAAAYSGAASSGPC
jgi:PPM family protein phosphatase